MLQDNNPPDLESLAATIKAIGSRAIPEEKLKIEVEKLLGKFISLGDLTVDPSYEFTFISGKRADALYGHVIIEYESPGALKRTPQRNHAIYQLKDYIKEAAANPENLHRFFGVAIDGRQIIFVRYLQAKKNWIVSRPFDINAQSIGRMMEAIRALHKKPLDAELMIKDFGPESAIAQTMVKLLYNSEMRTARAQTLYGDWRRVFQQVSAYSPNRTEGLEKVYNVGEIVDYEKLLFSIHTYYAFIMKLIAAEVVMIYGEGRFALSFLEGLSDAETQGKLKNRLQEVESGVLFDDLKFIKNFVDGDYFSWYLDEWNNPIHDAVLEIIKNLAEYEIGTTDLEPERVRDLFKSLYQKLIPRAIRIKLGEYYTPDWLADLVLDTAGYTVKNFVRMAKSEKDTLAPLNVRFLDPSCGSGTFLLLAIRRIREYAETNFVDPKTLVDKITANIVGFDLNPLAVIASRTNYLLALGELTRELRKMKDRELPIFLADSIMVEERSTLHGKNYILRTTVGEFSVPKTVMENGQLNHLLSIITTYVSKEYSKEEFLARLKVELAELDEIEAGVIGELYALFLDLEQRGRNKIWTSIIRNSFAPLFKGKFDFVIGNPPWISWDNLPETYRKTLEAVWKEVWPSYKLVDPGGAFKKDIASLFVAYCFTNYLKCTGILAFLVPFTLFKAQSGKSFRRFLANSTKVHTIHDLVSLKPFEGATNRTSMLICSNGSTKFPLRVWSWGRKEGESIGFYSTLDKVKTQTKRTELVMEPIEGIGFPESSWLMVKNGAQTPLRKIIAVSQYEAQEGINTRGANGILFLQASEEQEDDLPHVHNMNEEGAKDTDQKSGYVEIDLLYPLLRGEDVKRWHAEPLNFIIVPNNPKTGEPYNESYVKINYPSAYEFLLKFKDALEDRKHYNKSLKELGLPFYTLFQVNQNTFSEYKVVWKEIGGEISGKGDFSASVIGPSVINPDVKLPKKCAIPDHKLMFVPCKTAEEAFFVAGILNSSPSRLVVASYTIETSMSTHLLNYVKIPAYDKDDKNHIAIMKMSKKAHKYYDNATKLKNIEIKLDRLVAKLYGITAKELTIIKQSLDILLRSTTHR